MTKILNSDTFKTIMKRKLSYQIRKINMKTKQKTKYEVLVVNEWIRCKKAAVQPSGWLHYELKDGTIGLTPAKKWREATGKLSNT